MGDTRWGGVRIVDDGRKALRRASLRLRRRFTTGPVRWRRHVTAWVVVAAVVLGGTIWHGYRDEIRELRNAREVQANIDELRRGAKALATARAGALTANPHENLLDEILRRQYAHENVCSGVNGYQILALTQVQERPPLLAITIRCSTDERCADLRAAHLDVGGFVASKSPAANPLVLVFAVRDHRRD